MSNCQSVFLDSVLILLHNHIIMKKINLIIFSAFITLFPVAHTSGQDLLRPRITVLPLENRSADMQVDIVSANIKKTIDLNLKILDRYEIVQTKVNDFSRETDWLKNFCLENRIDSVIFGEASMTDMGSINIDMSVYSRETENITLSRSGTAETVFDIFDTSETLAVEMMEGFSGIHMGFGSLEVINTGDEGKYTLLIDDVLIGDNIRKVSKILNGSRVIKVNQDRMFGAATILEKELFIEENKGFTIDLSIPGFTEEEAAAINGAESYIRENRENLYYRNRIDKRFETLDQLLTSTDYSKTASDKKADIELLKNEWISRKELWDENRGMALLDRKTGLTVFAGTAFYTPHYAVEGEPGWGYTPSLSARAGLSLSKRLSTLTSVQVEANFTMVETKVNNSLNLSSSLVEFPAVEIPLYYKIRLPDKRFSLYGGGSIIRNIGTAYIEMEAPGMTEGFDDDDGEYVEKTGINALAGLMIEIPVNRHIIVLDLRYTRALNDWSKDDNAEFFPDCFATTIGYEWKFD